jgi:two-component system, OmpR family, sensor kinase
MFRSIRWTLQLWHAGILLLALAALGTALYVAASRTTYAVVDNELESAARVLAGPPIIAPPGPPNQSMDSRLAMASKLAPVADAPDALAEISPPPPARPDTLAWLKNVPRDCLNRLGWDQRDQPYFAVWASDGSLIRQSLDCPQIPAPARNGKQIAAGSDPPQFRQRADLREIVMPGPEGSTVLVGRSIDREQASLLNLRWSLFGVAMAVLTIGLLGGWLLSQRVLRPIRSISDTAGAISASDLSRRIDTRKTQSELGALAQTLNDTFDRLETAFHRQVQFTADASHELRTPLSIIHAGSELALSRPRTPEEYRQIIETSLRASQRMKSLVESLLVLARADADALELKIEKLDLRQAVEESMALLLPMAQHRGVRIYTDGPSLEIEADRERILQLITNLLTNAIQYNRECGSVQIAVSQEDGAALLRIADTGVGIAPADKPRVFERFFRADKARSRVSGGCGLGLAICQSIVSAHGGTISFASEPGIGTTFMVRLPLSRERFSP